MGVPCKVRVCQMSVMKNVAKMGRQYKTVITLRTASNGIERYVVAGEYHF